MDVENSIMSAFLVVFGCETEQLYFRTSTVILGASHRKRNTDHKRTTVDANQYSVVSLDTSKELSALYVTKLVVSQHDTKWP